MSEFYIKIARKKFSPDLGAPAPPVSPPPFPTPIQKRVALGNKPNITRLSGI